MGQIVVGNGSIANIYSNPTTTPEGNNAVRSLIASVPVVISKLYFSTQAPGLGETTTLTLFKNNVATSVVVVVDDLNLSNANIVDDQTFAAGDSYEFRATKSGASASTSVSYSFQSQVV